MGRKYQVISADGHVETPPEPWTKHVPAKHRDRAPRLIHLPDGQGDAWVVEGQAILHTGQNVTGPGPVKFAHGTYFDENGKPKPGTGDAKQRLQEQDLDGIDAEVLFPPVFATRFIEGIQDRDVYRSIVQAYNTFLAEDYCSVAPDRLIGAAFMPVSGIDDAVAELERAHANGLKTVNFQQFPNGTGGPKVDDNRFWEKALELGMALSPHLNFGDAAGPHPRGPDTSDQKVAGGMTQHCATLTPAYSLAQMIIDGVFDRFPELRFYYAEVNAAYLPGMLYYMDRDYTEYNDWFQFPLKKLPSEYVLEHCMFGMIQERPAIKMAQAGLMPMDWFMWATDFPHSVGTFPNSQKYIADAFADVDEATKRKVILENPANFYGLDLESDITPTPV
ncbi:MAG: amidohydrolase family protein [Acidimicrobiia bacterium]